MNIIDKIKDKWLVLTSKLNFTLKFLAILISLVISIFVIGPFIVIVLAVLSFIASIALIIIVAGVLASMD